MHLKRGSLSVVDFVCHHYWVFSTPVLTTIPVTIDNSELDCSSMDKDTFGLVLGNTAFLDILLEYLCLVHRQIIFNTALKSPLIKGKVNEHYKIFRKK